MIALDIDQFIGEDVFIDRIGDLIARTKAVPLARDATEIVVPGELESRAEARNRLHGIELPRKTIDDLVELARSCGVDDGLLVAATV